MRPKDAWALSLLLMVLVDVACGSILGRAETQDVADTAARIAKCQAEGRACKADASPDAYGCYDDCMKDAGLR